MSYSVRWTSEALTTFQGRWQYLTIHWTEKEIKAFSERVKKYLETLSVSPFIGKHGKFKNVYIGLIIKEVSLVYRIKPKVAEIELISFFDNRQDPKKIRKYKA